MSYSLKPLLMICMGTDLQNLLIQVDAVKDSDHRLGKLEDPEIARDTGNLRNGKLSIAQDDDWD